MIILLDCDGPMADFTTAYLDALYAETGARHHASEVDRWAIHECPFFVAHAKGLGGSQSGSLRAQCDARVVAPGFCASIRPQPGAREAVAALRGIGDVYVVTSPWFTSRTWMHERTAWLWEHFGIHGNRVIHTSSKALIRGDMFVDDKPSHVFDWQDAWPNGRALLLDMPHNQDGGVPRVSRAYWSDVVEVARHVAEVCAARATS